MSFNVGSWFIQGSLSLVVKKPGHLLQVNLVATPDGDWYGLAITTPEPGVDGPEVLDRLLAQHAHKPIGSGSLETMMITARKYASAWVQGADPLASCECHERGATMPLAGDANTGSPD